ncbi:MAG: hypothetical protein JW940_38715 [Polyangiaceae bacterium]|nr:hypothetical protein [Polyangiaceae bacterium]
MPVDRTNARIQEHEMPARTPGEPHRGPSRTTGTVWILALSIALAVSCKHRRASEDDPSSADFRDGDLIFQESSSRQSDMVRVLTRSRWTHMGVVFNEPRGTVVLEAASPVRKTPVRTWIARGRGRRFVLKRLRDADRRLRGDVVAKMKKLGAAWLGRPYDVRFQWGDDSLYCSELAHKLFARGADIQIGKLERASDMNLDDDRVRRALRKRFANARFNPAETVVTPDSIFNDRQLVEVEPRGI